MKRRSLISLCVCAIAAGGLLVGCSDDAAKNGVLKVGASPVPHADILKAAQPMLAKEGVKLEVIEFTDYVQPNMGRHYLLHTFYLASEYQCADQSYNHLRKAVHLRMVFPQATLGQYI